MDNEVHDPAKALRSLIVAILATEAYESKQSTPSLLLKASDYKSSFNLDYGSIDLHLSLKIHLQLKDCNW